MQLNARKIPSSIKVWREKNGTDAVMARVLVKKGATMEEVKAAIDGVFVSFNHSL